jgi:hypothetical protein
MTPPVTYICCDHSCAARPVFRQVFHRVAVALIKLVEKSLLKVPACLPACPVWRRRLC